MVKINVRRFDDHPHGHQGCIKPEDERWMLMIDKDGEPHMFVRVKIDADKTGWLDIDQMLPGTPIRGLIDVEAGPEPEDLTEAQIEEALAGMFCPGPTD